MFGPCTASPYREGAGYTCSQLAMEAEEDECWGQCEDISTGAGAAACQQCLSNIIDPSCQLPAAEWSRLLVLWRIHTGEVEAVFLI